MLLSVRDVITLDNPISVSCFGLEIIKVLAEMRCSAVQAFDCHRSAGGQRVPSHLLPAHLECSARCECYCLPLRYSGLFTA